VAAGPLGGLRVPLGGAAGYLLRAGPRRGPARGHPRRPAPPSILRLDRRRAGRRRRHGHAGGERAAKSRLPPPFRRLNTLIPVLTESAVDLARGLVGFWTLGIWLDAATQVRTGIDAQPRLRLHACGRSPVAMGGVVR